METIFMVKNMNPKAKSGNPDTAMPYAAQDDFMNIATICSSNRMVPIKNSPPQVTAVNKARQNVFLP